MKYRKKPIIIEAIQWVGGNYEILNDFCGLHWTRADVQNMPPQDEEQVIVYNMKEKQWLYVPIGHWIVRGIKGELYPCDPDVFEMTYEKVNPDSLPTIQRGRQGGNE